MERLEVGHVLGLENLAHLALGDGVLGGRPLGWP